MRPREGAGWEPTWLQGGRIPVAAVQDLFEAARALYAIAPWKSVYDGQVIRMDIPDLDVDGACVSIIGQLGESTGILIFPTPMDYASFRDAAERHVEGRRREAFKAGLLALNYERAEDLPPGMRREMDEHGWPVVGLHACPEVQRMEPVPILHPLTERDLRIVTACARSLVGFFLKSGQTFEADDPEPVCVSFFDENDFEVRFTVPYGARHQFDLEHGEDGDAEDEEPGAATAAFGSVAPVGRNDPCPCGSGRKYKHCHMHLDKQAEAAGAIRHRLHDLDNDLVERIALFAMRRFGSAFDEVLLGFMDQSEHEQLGRIWAVYGHSLEGRSAAEWFLEEKAGMLGRRERDWIKAQMNAWLSIWEVTDVDYGVSVTIRDLLSGQIRTVPETSASRTLVLRDTVLGRVVDSDAVSLLCGVHHRPLPPVEADSVAERVRRRLRRKGLVPIERLRDPDFGGYLIRAWRKAVRELDRRASVRPVLHNMDGDLLRLTRDMFSVRPESRRSIESALSEWPDVDAHTTEEGAREFMINRAPRSKASKVDTVVVGRAFFEEGVLHIETNSVERADTLRARFENAFAGEIGHLQRQHVDLFAGREAGGGRSAASPRFLEPSSPELDALTLQHKERHYADWIDHPLPALNGESPRAAAQSEAGRRAVELLLKGMENREQRRPEGTRFDFSEIRRKLGLG